MTSSLTFFQYDFLYLLDIFKRYINKQSYSVSDLNDMQYKEGDKLILEVSIDSADDFNVKWLCKGSREL